MKLFESVMKEKVSRHVPSVVSVCSLTTLLPQPLTVVVSSYVSITHFLGEHSSTALKPSGTGWC